MGFNFGFDELCTIQATTLLINLEGGRINVSRLMLLLFLVDCEKLLKTGVTLTGDRYVRTSRGVILCEVKNRINRPELYDFWNRHIEREFEGNNRSLISYNRCGTGELCEYDIEVLNWIHTYSMTKTYDILTGLQLSVGLIECKDILKVSGVSEKEINEMSELNQYISDVHEYLRAKKLRKV
jgi:hypothetical protein